MGLKIMIFNIVEMLSGLKLVQKFFTGVSQNNYSKYWGLENSEDFIYQIRIKKPIRNLKVEG